MTDGTTADGSATTVRDAPEEQRFVLEIDGEEAGELGYRGEGDAVVLDHTEVDPHRREKGLGGRLVEAAIRDLHSRGVRMVAECPFVVALLERRPELAALVNDAEAPTAP